MNSWIRVMVRLVTRVLLLSAVGLAIWSIASLGAASADSIITVSDTCTLADAITSANTNTSVGGCVAGTGVDTIVLPGGTIMPPASLPDITDHVTIEGNGTIVDMNSQFNNVFRVDGATVVSINSLEARGANVAAITNTLAWFGQLNLDNVTLSGSFSGLDVGAFGTATITNSTFESNAFGTRFFGLGAFMAANSTYSGNGTGFEAKADGGTTLTHVTLAHNTATGLSNTSSGDVTVQAILAVANGADCSGVALTADTTSISSDGSCLQFTTAPAAATQLSPLDYNGCAQPCTRTHELVIGNPAIDHVNNCLVFTDQRSMQRPQGNACDAGAYEAETPTTDTVMLKVNVYGDGLFDTSVTFVPEDVDGAPATGCGDEVTVSTTGTTPTTSTVTGSDGSDVTLRAFLLALLPFPDDCFYTVEQLQAAGFGNPAPILSNVESTDDITFDNFAFETDELEIFLEDPNALGLPVTYQILFFELDGTCPDPQTPIVGDISPNGIDPIEYQHWGDVFQSGGFFVFGERLQADCAFGLTPLAPDGFEFSPETHEFSTSSDSGPFVFELRLADDVPTLDTITIDLFVIGETDVPFSFTLTPDGGGAPIQVSGAPAGEEIIVAVDAGQSYTITQDPHPGFQPVQTSFPNVVSGDRVTAFTIATAVLSLDILVAGDNFGPIGFEITPLNSACFGFPTAQTVETIDNLATVVYIGFDPSLIGGDSNKQCLLEIVGTPPEGTTFTSGGASAVYGSDALAGVVNFQLIEEFEGAEFTVLYDTTTNEDGEHFQFDFTVGGDSDCGRGNAVTYGSYTARIGIAKGCLVDVTIGPERGMVLDPDVFTDVASGDKLFFTASPDYRLEIDSDVFFDLDDPNRVIYIDIPESFALWMDSVLIDLNPTVWDGPLPDDNRISFVFPAEFGAGTYDLTLTATLLDGSIYTDTFPVTVGDPPAVVVAPAPPPLPESPTPATATPAPPTSVAASAQATPAAPASVAESPLAVTGSGHTPVLQLGLSLTAVGALALGFGRHRSQRCRF